MHRRTFLSLSMTLAIGLAACGSKGPELPSQDSMLPDLSAFSDETKSNSASFAQTAGDHSNFNNAALRVGLLNLWLAVAIAPPATVFAVALNEEPTFTDGAWLWDYSETVNGNQYGAKLSGAFSNGERVGTDLELEMAVTCSSCETALDDYVWYTGEFDNEGSTGSWTFYDASIDNDDQKIVTVDYDVPDDSHGLLTITNVRADGHENAGDIIEYERDGDLVSVGVHDESEGLDYQAQASLADGSGWIQVPDYNNGEKACWDSERNNIDCD